MTLPQSGDKVEELRKKSVKGQENRAKIEGNPVRSRTVILKGILVILSIASVLQFVLIIMTITQVSYLQTRLAELDEDMERMQNFVASCSKSGKILNPCPSKTNDNILKKERHQETTDDETTKQFNFEDGGSTIDNGKSPAISQNPDIPSGYTFPVLKRTKRRSKKKKPKSKNIFIKAKGTTRIIVSGKHKAVKYSKGIGIHVRSGQLGSNSHGLPTAKLLKGWSDVSGSTTSFNTDKLQREGYLTVLRTGLYYLYSQVVVENPNTTYITAELDVGTRGTTTFSKCSFSSPEEHSSSNGRRRLTCNTNGVVELHEGDGISIRVYPPNVEIDTAPEYTYFGAFMIGTL